MSQDITKIQGYDSSEVYVNILVNEIQKLDNDFKITNFNHDKTSNDIRPVKGTIYNLGYNESHISQFLNYKETKNLIDKIYEFQDNFRFNHSIKFSIEEMYSWLGIVELERIYELLGGDYKKLKEKHRGHISMKNLNLT